MPNYDNWGTITHTHTHIITLLLRRRRQTSRGRYVCACGRAAQGEGRGSTKSDLFDGCQQDHPARCSTSVSYWRGTGQSLLEHCWSRGTKVFFKQNTLGTGRILFYALASTYHSFSLRTYLVLSSSIYKTGTQEINLTFKKPKPNNISHKLLLMQTFDLLLFVYGFISDPIQAPDSRAHQRNRLRAANNSTQRGLRAYQLEEGLPKQQLFWKFFVDHSFIIVWEHLQTKTIQTF